MDHYHKDHYKVFNFCCEPGRGYNPEVFYGRVERYPFKDHNTPPLETMAAFANSVKQWLDSDPENVVNMHCKAGKGRAGLMCCVALIRTGENSSRTYLLCRLIIYLCFKMKQKASFRVPKKLSICTIEKESTIIAGSP